MYLLLCPHITLKVKFEPMVHGLPIEESELLEEITKVTEKALEVLNNDRPSVIFINEGDTFEEILAFIREVFKNFY